MKSSELNQRRQQATPRGVGVMCSYFVEKAENATLWDIEGNEVIDFAAGIAVLNTGHRHPKIVAAVEIDEKRGIKRAYFKKIDDYSSGELEKIFQSHISPEANAKTDKWKGYKPLKKKYSIEQIKSNTSDFFEMNTIVHQVKSWLRSVYSWMHEQHIEKYLDEYGNVVKNSWCFFEK